MFKEKNIDEFMYNMQEDRGNFDDLTEREMELLLKSYKMMQDLAMQGKMIYSFDQVWLM